MEYYIIAIITFISAFLGMVFSIISIIKEKTELKTNTLYMSARSIAILIMTVVSLCKRIDSLLIVSTLLMLTIQTIDGFIGIYKKSYKRTLGPFILAILHLICLCVYIK